MLYHVSPTPGLTVLTPHISSHGAAYVYAIDCLATALLFGAKKDDFDFLLDVNEAGVPELWECYPHAFETIYRGKACTVYEVEATGFQQGLTGWEPEWVSTEEVPVQRAYPVENLYEALFDEVEKSRLILHQYERTPDYRRLIANHVIDRVIRLDWIERMDTDSRFQTHFSELRQSLKHLLTGNWLP